MPSYARNRRARFEYEILETFEAGLVLTGQEAKSIRSGNAKITDAFVVFKGKSPELLNAHIPKYPFAGNLTTYDPDRSRAILLGKKEISYLRGKTGIKGLTMVPLSIYTKGRRIKMEIGLVRGKKLYEKKEIKKQRDLDKEMSRAMKEVR